MSVILDELGKNKNRDLRVYFTREVLLYLQDEMYINLAAFGRSCNISRQFMYGLINLQKNISSKKFTLLFNGVVKIYGFVWEKFLPLSYIDLDNYLKKKYHGKTLEEIMEYENK